jgi:hypothetical protein
MKYLIGHPESKKTALWLKGLSKLLPTNIVEESPRVFSNLENLCRSGMPMLLNYLKTKEQN